MPKTAGKHINKKWLKCIFYHRLPTVIDLREYLRKHSKTLQRSTVSKKTDFMFGVRHPRLLPKVLHPVGSLAVQAPGLHGSALVPGDYLLQPGIILSTGLLI